jgi:very-short-patch-repair endonuclease
MAIKFQLPDPTPNGKKRLSNAKGHANVDQVKTGHFVATARADTPVTRFAQFAGSGANVAITQPMFFSPMHTPQNWQIASKRKEIYQWARFYYENEPKVAAGVDFYAQFPMNGFELQCKSKHVQRYYDDLVKSLRLNYWLAIISHEYFLIGDVFPFLSVDCKKCGGRGVLRNGEPCNHPDGRFRSLTILNPDFIEVEDSLFPERPNIVMIPDDTMKKIVQTQQPKEQFDRLPKDMIALIMSGQPIPLSKRCVSHIKHSEVPYAKYGTSMLRRLFTILAYKTKLMTANWIVAERLVLPVRICKIGSDDRPADAADIEDFRNQLSAVANDPNLTIVTHHNVDYEWYGAEGKIHNIQAEMEEIGKEILDGLMLNQALLNGEMQGYTSAQVGIETLIKRLDNWRFKLGEWVEEHIFKPTAMMQGFVDEDETKKLGKTVYLYPTIKWNDMQLRDKTNKLQLFMQLHDKQIISTEKLCEEFDIDYDQEVERIRQEQMAVGAGGAAMGGQGAGGAGGDAAGGAGGGMSGAVGAPGGGAGDAGGGAGGAPPMGGGGAGGAPGGAPAGGGGMGAAAQGGTGRVHKRGKAPKEEEAAPPPAPTFIRLTKIEQKLLKTLQDLQIPFQLYGQYQQPIEGSSHPYQMDFAFPQVMVDIEADGKIWHEKEGAKERDAERDKKLAQLGWRVIRFNEDAINENIDEVKKVIYDNVKEAADERFSQRKKSSNDEGIRYSSSRVHRQKFGAGEILTVLGGDPLDDINVYDEDGGSPEDQGQGDQVGRELPREI